MASVHFWSINVQYLGYSISLMSAFMGGFFALVKFFLIFGIKYSLSYS